MNTLPVDTNQMSLFLPRLDTFSVHAQPEAFTRKFDRFVQLLRENDLIT